MDFTHRWKMPHSRCGSLKQTLIKTTSMSNLRSLVVGLHMSFECEMILGVLSLSVCIYSTASLVRSSGFFLLSAAGIGRIGSICAADFTAGSRRLIYECTRRTGPAWRCVTWFQFGSAKLQHLEVDVTDAGFLWATPTAACATVAEAGR